MIELWMLMFYALGASLFSAFTTLFGTIAIIIGSILLWDYLTLRTKRGKKR